MHKLGIIARKHPSNSCYFKFATNTSKLIPATSKASFNINLALVCALNQPVLLAPSSGEEPYQPSRINLNFRTRLDKTWTLSKFECLAMPVSKHISTPSIGNSRLGMFSCVQLSSKAVWGYASAPHSNLFTCIEIVTWLHMPIERLQARTK